MTDSELLNCPFCGASAEVTNRLNLKWARCSYFDCFMHSHEVMPEMWNRRSAPPGEGQWVPKEPIEAMFDAVWSNFGATDFEGLHKKLSIHELRQLYKMFYSRMLAAAPSHHSGAVVQLTRKQIARAIQFLDLTDAFESRTPYGTASEMLSHIFDKAREFTEDGEALRHPSSTGAEVVPFTEWDKKFASPPSASEQGWVSVKERLPDPYDSVLLYYDGLKETGYYGWKGFLAHGNVDRIVNPTHWMPLPSPPTAQEKAP